MGQTYRVFKELAEVTNGADGTYNYYMNMSEFSSATIQLELSGGSGSVTVTVEASAQSPTDIAAASATYQDITLALFGVANVTSSSMFIIDNPTAFGWVKIKVVAATGGANDADWTVYTAGIH